MAKVCNIKGNQGLMVTEPELCGPLVLLLENKSLD